jgi:probable HAF family extracellular repeat protein
VEVLEDRTLPSGGYVFTAIDDPNAGTSAFQGTTAAGINSLGQIAGYYQDANFQSHGFLLSGGQYITLDFPGNSETNITAVNDKGEMVGYAGLGGIPFELTDGQYTTLFPPPAGASFVFPSGVNSFGHIVGFYQSFGTAHGESGFLFSKGRYTVVNAPNVSDTFLTGVNDFSQSVGYFTTSATTTAHGFMLNSGQFTPINGPLGAHGVQPHGINDLGTIVGYYNGADGYHGFVDSGGQYVTIDDPNAAPGSTYALGINVFGQVVGYYLDAMGTFHGFLATPANAPVAPGASLAQSLFSAVGDENGVQPAWSAARALFQDGILPEQVQAKAAHVGIGEAEALFLALATSPDSLSHAEDSAGARLILPGTRASAESGGVTGQEGWASSDLIPNVLHIEADVFGLSRS